MALYLLQPGQRSGDGAAYVLQAIDGPVLDRAVHAGWLLPLSGVVRGLGALGVAPSLAGNLAALAVSALLLMLLRDLARDLRAGGTPERAGEDPQRSRTARRPELASLLAPGVALGAAATWDAALFVEVYGPLSAALLCAALLLRRGRPLGAGAAIFLAFAIHPASAFLVPGVLVAAGPPRKVLWVAVGLGVGLALGWIALLGLEPFLGARGALATPDVTVWQSLQRAARLLTRDLGLAAAPLLLGVLLAARTPQGRRWLLGSLLVLLGVALGLDRFSDNPGQLLTLLLLCPLAAFAVDVAPWLPDAAARSTGRWALIVVVVVGIAESSSRHDAVARRAKQQDRAFARDCGDDLEAALGGAPPDWALTMRRRLVCRVEGGSAPGVSSPSSSTDR